MISQRISLSTMSVIGAGFAGALLSISFYFRDIENEGNGEERGDPIGFVTTSNEDVSRRPAGRWLWTSLEVARPVFEQDTIRTGAGSQAAIDLGEFGEIQLRPDSLVVLETRKEGVRVNVASGELLMKGRMTAQVGGTQVSAEDSIVKISRQAGQLQIQAEKGRASIQTDKGSAQLKPGSILVTDKNGQVDVQKYPLIRVQPSDGEVIRLPQEGAPVGFRLTLTETTLPEGAHIEIARDPTFKRLVKSVPILEASQETFTDALSEGNYHWRAVLQKNQIPLSTSGTFEIRNPPRLQWSQTERPPLLFKEGGLSWDLPWKGIRDAASYGIKLSRDGKLVEEFLLSARPTRLILRDNRGPAWTELSRVTDTSALGLNVELHAYDIAGKDLAPPISSTVPIKDDRQAQGLSLTTLKVGTDLKKSELIWKVDGAFKEIELDVGESIPRKSSGNSMSFDTAFLYDLGPSPRIRVITPSGIPGPWRKFSLDTEALKIVEFSRKPPRIQFPLDGSTVVRRGRADLNFQWSAVSNTLYQPLSYDIVIKGPKGFRTKEKSTKDPTYTIPIPDSGEYTWKVRAVWKDFGPSPFSSEQSFTIGSGAALQAPRLRRPASVKSSGDDFE
jgi:hypothetical protein